MTFWPFRKKQVERLSLDELRTRLITVASESKRRRQKWCQLYKDQVVANVDALCKIPEELASDPASINNYVQAIGEVAQCLATHCQTPELWEKLCGTSEDNPILQWNQWLDQLPERMERLEYDELITEAKSNLERAKSLGGPAARQYETFMLGRLGELLFHSGKVLEAVEPFEAALARCINSDDIEGEMTYLNFLLEAHRYLGDSKQAVSTAEKLLKLQSQLGHDTNEIEKRIQLLQQNEPLCRIVCVHDGNTYEMVEITSIKEGRFGFQFVRNRMALQMASTIVQQGNELATNGQLADALEKYQQASEVDPYNPDPLYQSGMCLLELGAFAQAKNTFEEVEQLAPGWFRCRSDIWLAEALDKGTVTVEEFQLLRALDDGGLNPNEALAIAKKAIDTYPGFAAFHLILGDLLSRSGNTNDAIDCYRAGLKLTPEPDLESRLLCSLAGALPKDAPERSALIERALSLKGNLTAQATARLIGLQ